MQEAESKQWRYQELEIPRKTLQSIVVSSVFSRCSKLKSPCILVQETHFGPDLGRCTALLGHVGSHHKPKLIWKAGEVHGS